MNKTQDVADALVAWTREKIEAIKTGYAFPTDQKVGALPDVAAEIQKTSLQRTDTQNFPESGIDQVMLRVHDFHLMFLVEPDPPDEATIQLEEFIDIMTEQILLDPSMGGVLPSTSISPIFDSSYTPPFVEFEDGTQGRIATMELKVGELVGSDDGGDDI